MSTITTDVTDLLVGVIALNGGEMIGKTRLQKTFFLLDQCGMNSGAEFDYHNFGPFSADVATAADDAEAEGRLSAELRPGFHAEPYTRYRTDASPKAFIGGLSRERAAKKLKVMRGYSAIELEIAATIVYLRQNGYEHDAEGETRRRKPTKATKDRVDRALRLIRELSLSA